MFITLCYTCLVVISMYISVYLVSSVHVCTFKYYLCAYKCLEKEKLQDNLTCKIFHLVEIEAPLFTNILQNILEYVSD